MGMGAVGEVGSVMGGLITDVGWWSMLTTPPFFFFFFNLSFIYPAVTAQITIYPLAYQFRNLIL